jgi:hypothetical protein
MCFTTLLGERRDALPKLVCRLNERKVPGVFKRTKRGPWEMRRKPLHMCPIRIGLPDDEQRGDVELRNVYSQIVLRQLASERRRVSVNRELQRFEQGPMFVVTDKKPRPHAAKVFAKISVCGGRGCLGVNWTSGGRHEDQMGQRLGPTLRVLEGQEAAVRVTKQRKLLQS